MKNNMIAFLFLIIKLNTVFTQSDLKMQFIVFNNKVTEQNYFDTFKYKIFKDSFIDESNEKTYISLLFINNKNIDTLYYNFGLKVDLLFLNNITFDINISKVDKLINYKALREIGDFCFLNPSFLNIKISDSTYLTHTFSSYLASFLYPTCVKKNIFRVLLFKPKRYYSNKLYRKKYKEFIKQLEKSRDVHMLATLLNKK